MGIVANRLRDIRDELRETREAQRHQWVIDREERHDDG